MGSRYVLWPSCHRGKLVDVERGGVGEQQRAGLHHVVQLREDRLLHVHLLEHRLDHHVAVADVLVVRHRFDARKSPLHFVLGQRAATHRGGIVVADTLHAAIQRFLRRVQDLHRIAEVGEAHCDAAAHGARTDHSRVGEIAYRRIGGDVRQPGHFALDEERVAQRARLRRILQLLEQIGLAPATLVERQYCRRFDRIDARIWCLLVACPPRYRLAHRVKDAGVRQLHGAITHARQRSHGQQPDQPGDRALQQIGGLRQQFIDDAERSGLACGHVTASDNHVQRRLWANQPGQPLRATAARQDADEYLRQPDFRAGQREAIVAGHRDLEPSAERIAVNSGQHRLLARVQHIVYTLAERQPRPVGAEAANVGAGDETAPCADKDHALDGRVGVAAGEAILDAFGNTGAKCVHRRVVYRDDADLALTFKADG